MPITLTTGTPGAGKTLRTLWDVENLRKDSVKEALKKDDPKLERHVYYHGIKNLRLPWIQLDDDPKFDPEAKPATFGMMCTEWYKLPPGSIVVLDECQRIFRTRASGSAVPLHVSELETHRAKGLDLFLITQHPSIIDLNVRRQVQTHRHLKRRFGTQMVSMFSWEGGVKDNPDKSVSNALTTTFRYPKQVFSWYKSAEIHTVKAKVPVKVWFILAAPLLIIGLGFFAAKMMKGMSDTDAIKETPFFPATAHSGGSKDGAKPQLTAREKHGDEQMREYYAAEQPRIAGMPWTAPKYDGVTQPSIAPIFEGCIIFKQEAWCYLQGGVKRKVTMDFAQNFIANQRPFIDFQSTLERGQLGVSPGATKPLIAQDS